MALGCRPSQPRPLKITFSWTLLVEKPTRQSGQHDVTSPFPLIACMSFSLTCVCLIITTGIIVSEAGAIRWCAIPVGMSPTTPDKRDLE